MWLFQKSSPLGCSTFLVRLRNSTRRRHLGLRPYPTAHIISRLTLYSFRPFLAVQFSTGAPGFRVSHAFKSQFFFFRLVQCRADAKSGRGQRRCPRSNDPLISTADTRRTKLIRVWQQVRLIKIIFKIKYNHSRIHLIQYLDSGTESPSIQCGWCQIIQHFLIGIHLWFHFGTESKPTFDLFIRPNDVSSANNTRNQTSNATSVSLMPSGPEHNPT